LRLSPHSDGIQRILEALQTAAEERSSIKNELKAVIVAMKSEVVALNGEVTALKNSRDVPCESTEDSLDCCDEPEDANGATDLQSYIANEQRGIWSLRRADSGSDRVLKCELCAPWIGRNTFNPSWKGRIHGNQQIDKQNAKRKEKGAAASPTIRRKMTNDKETDMALCIYTVALSGLPGFQAWNSNCSFVSDSS